jgi:preprotein translocase subunit SecA
VTVLDKILRIGEGKILRNLERIVVQVNAIEPAMQACSDEELRAITQELKLRHTNGESLDDLMPEAFALVREAAWRVLGQRHYDVQIMGGAALHLGNISEMRTGEGKTLVSTLPAFLNALSGEGVHVVTVNDYLAERDSEWMGRVHRFLGLHTSCILSGMNSAERREAYAADITYGTNNEFGFDYLRDTMSWSKDELVQRGHNFAIVDEVDSILIDEARTPLIISGASDEKNDWYEAFAKFVRTLQIKVDYEVDEKKRTVGVLESAISKTEKHFGISNLYESVNTHMVGLLNNAIKAKELYKRDRDYVVINGEVQIVDEHTGRLLAGRRYGDGMHQAIEAKEGVQIQAENQTLATITLQNYFRLYNKLSGMTGTAMTEASEFSQIYRLGVIPIPTHRPMIRVDQADLIYRTAAAKFTAVIDDISERYEKGQPVLVGTTSVEKSELVSALLKKRGIPHNVLNAKFHEKEASIVAMAGRKGAVTVATNMAGRGTDIMLGGNVDFIARAELEKQGLTADADLEKFTQAWSGAVAKATELVAGEHEEVKALGGLYVLGTERHESRRIDNQLRGRSGRQGDPGESRFYLSLEDDLMRLFKSDMVNSFLQRFNVPDDVPIEASMVTKSIKSAQTQVESNNFDIRKNILKYDEVLNRQRLVIYGERRDILNGADISEHIQRFVTDTVEGYIDAETADVFDEEWNLERLHNAFAGLYPIQVDLEQLAEESSYSPEFIKEEVLADIRAAYAARETNFSSVVMRELERKVVLSVLDRKWRDHLYEMQYLQEGIGLRAMAQKDPLVEYQREGYDLFVAMMDSLKEEVIGLLFNVKVNVQSVPSVNDDGEVEAEIEVAGAKPPAAPRNLAYLAPSESGEPEIVNAAGARTSNGPSRNSQCPCGSGKKYKRCHGSEES